MPGTFTYNESTNTVVVLNGTSGSPSDFASFVTADRAGVDTDLLVAGSPASALALTYAVRPVEDLAILVKCIVANKTAEADFIFITGKDWRGAAQTESIDVTAGNASYTSTKYWSEITTLDCSDNAAGGGVVWADGDLSVTQDIWGVIWDYGNGQYQIDAIFNVGNGSTSTYFQSKLELICFADALNIQVKTNATLELGDLSGSWGIDGSFWSISPDTNNLDFLSGGTFLLYASKFHSRADKTIDFETGTIDIRNSIVSMEGSGAGDWRKAYRIQGGLTATVKNVFFSNLYSLLPIAIGTYEDVRVHDANQNIRTFDAVTLTGFIFTTTGDVELYNGSYVGTVLTIIDPGSAVASVKIENHESNTIIEQYTCNIKVCDKDGANLASALVVCEDKDTNAAFTTQTTAADGTITEQTITYKTWTGTSETLVTSSPHKFTISKAGYETLILENITVDGPIDWHLELQTQNKLFGITNIVKVCGVG